MKIHHGLALLVAFIFVGCQPVPSPTVSIIDHQQVISLQTDENIPARLLAQAGLNLAPEDRLFANGSPTPLNQPVSRRPLTLQIRRAVSFTLVTPEGDQKIKSSAYTVGEALTEASIWLREGDKIFPALDSALQEGLTLTIYPARPITVSADGKLVEIQSAAQTVGEALAAAGIPLLGLDYSIPAEKEPLPMPRQPSGRRIGSPPACHPR